MKLSKIALAAAAFAAIASGSAFAGQIGSSSVTLATEVIYSDAQIVRAPSNVYSFAGDIDARTNTQRLQLQYTLSKGTWNVGAGQLFTAANTLVTLATGPGNGLDQIIQVAYNDGSNAGQTTFPLLSTGSAFVTADLKTLVFNLTIPGTAGNAFFLRAPAFTINAPAFVAGTKANAGVTGLATVAGVAACPAPDQNIDISFKHFTTHNGNTDLITNASPDSEHLRVNSTNTARFLNFVQNHVFAFTPSSTSSRQDAATLNQKLSGQNFAAVTTGAATNTNFLSAAFVGAQTGLRHYLGKATLNQRAQGVDTNYSDIYGDNGKNAKFLEAIDITIAGTGTLENGTVEASATSALVVTFPSALPTGAVVAVYNADGTAAAGANFVVTYNAARTVATVTVPTAAGLAALAAPAGTIAGFTNGVYLFTEFTGTNVIPQLAGITVAGTLAKVTAGANREQNVTCPGTLASIGGGIKIDIRNYASRAKFPAGDYASYVRLINNSETISADIYAQMIYADGTYGPYGQLPALAPRAVANYSNAQLEALLITTPPVANPFGAGAVYTQTQGTSVTAVGAAGIGDRVRFVSNTGTTLRIQSYLALPNGNLMDTSNAQGVDFENSTNNRTPSTAVDAQPVSQDAINGLAR